MNYRQRPGLSAAAILSELAAQCVQLPGIVVGGLASRSLLNIAGLIPIAPAGRADCLAGGMVALAVAARFLCAKRPRRRRIRPCPANCETLAIIFTEASIVLLENRAKIRPYAPGLILDLGRLNAFASLKLPKPDAQTCHL